MKNLLISALFGLVLTGHTVWAGTVPSFFEATGRPLVYAGVQTPPAFHKELSVLNRNRKVFVDPNEGDTFEDADVWGIFLNSPEQAMLLPKFLRSAYAQVVREDKQAPFTFARVQLDSGEEKAIAFVFLDHYGPNRGASVCKAARSVYRSVLGELTSETSKQDLRECSR